MTKKEIEQKDLEEEPQEEWEEEPQEEWEEEPQQEEEKIIDDENEVIDSSLEIGGQIHQQSTTVKRFYQLPKDVKYSNFGRIDLANFNLKSRTYDLFQYVRKVQNMAKYEIQIVKENRKDFYDIETLEDFKEYLKQNNKLYLWESLRNLPKEEIEKEWKTLKQQLTYTKESGFVEYLYGDNENFEQGFELHNSNYDKELNLVDDFGLLSSMMTLTEANKAQRGWATKMMNTTISETKNEDLSNEVEERPEQTESKGFGKFFKK